MFKITGAAWLVLVLSSTFFLFFGVKAYRKNSAPPIEEYKYRDDKRHRTKYNYFSKGDIDDVDNLREAYSTEPLEFEEDLPGLVVDYANMIRNDIILLDNSVQTQTRKRANFKMEKKYSTSIEPPCSCELNKTEKKLDVGYFTQSLEEANCSDQLCPYPYKCERRKHYVPLLRRKNYDTTESETERPVELPDDLRHRWLVRYVPITVGCLCQKNYLQEI